MPKGNGPGRVRRAAVALMVGVLAVPALSGCGEEGAELFDEVREAVGDNPHLQDTIDEVESATKDFEAAAEQSAKQQETLEEAERWESRPPKPDLEPVSEVKVATQDGETGKDLVIERTYYEGESYEEVLEHYRDTYGDPYHQSEDSTSWSKGADTLVRVDAPDAESGDVAVDSVWSRP